MGKKLLLSVAGGLIALTGFFGLQSAQADGYPANCGPSAVIKCGAYNQSELTARIKPDAQALYTKLGIGVNVYLAKDGVVYPDGTIKVDGKVVATDAMTFGRVKRNASDTPLTAGGTTFWKHSITGAAIHRPVDAFVFLDHNGKFTGAVIKMCGNPVVAVATAKPDAKCDLLSVAKIDRTRFKFTAKASTQDGAKITGYSIVVKRGSTTVDTTSITSASGTVTEEATYSTPGDYSATLTVKTTVGDKTGASCKTTFTVEPEPVAACKNLTSTITNRNHYRLDASASAENGATISGYKYEIRDTSSNIVVVSETVNTTANSSSIGGDLPAGKYSASVVVKTSLGERNGEQCITEFEIEEEPKYVEVCELDSMKIVTIKEEEFDASKHSTDPRDCVKDIEVCDLDSMQVITIKEDEFDSSKHSKDLSDCDEPGEITVCDLDTKKIVTIKEDQFDSSKHSTDLSDCYTEVCDLDSMEIITIKEEDFDATKHSRTLSDCDVVMVKVCDLSTNTIIEVDSTEANNEGYTTDLTQCEKIKVCDPDTGKIITVYKSQADDYEDENSASCKDEPVTELPETGLADTIGSIIGLGSLTAATYYYATSRRS